MTRNDMGQMMFVGIGDFDLIALVAVFDAVDSSVMLIASSVLFPVSIDSFMGCN